MDFYGHSLKMDACGVDVTDSICNNMSVCMAERVTISLTGVNLMWIEVWLSFS